jgi:zinc protease
MKRYLQQLVFALLMAALFASVAQAQTAPAQTPAPGTPATPAAKPSPAKPAVQKPWERIKIPPLPDFKPPQPTRLEFENGLVVFLMEDHELPLIEGVLRIRGGSREEPADKVGMVGIYGQAWRTGGTTSRTGDQLDEILESRAIRVETGGSETWTNLSWSSLKGDFDFTLPVILDLLKNPAFRDDKIALAKQQVNTAISRRNDDIGGIAARESTRLGYGKDSPYGRITEYWTIEKTTRDDLLAWHQRTVHPNNMILGVVGDFDSKEMEQKLRQAFGGWPKGPQFKSADIPVNDPQPGVYFIEKSDVNQSAIRMVHKGTLRNNPDYYAIEVLNEVLGGGFSGRLLGNIRSKKGLAYSVGGGVGTGFDRPGLFRISMGTKSETTAESIQALMQEIEDITTKPITDAEIKRAKDSILNSFVFNFDSPGEVMMEKMTYEFYGYPLDFIERYQAGIEKVTKAEIIDAAKKYIYKDKVALLVVGKASDFDKPLSTFGSVTPIDITIREAPESASSAATPATSSPQGMQLLSKALDALGGKDKLATVKAVREKSTIVRQTPQGEMEMQGSQLVVLPDKMYSEASTPMGAMKMVATADMGYMVMGPQSRDLPPTLRQEMQHNIHRSPAWIAANSDKVVATAAGTAKVGDKEAAVLEITAGEAKTKWFLDSATGRLLREEYRAVSMRGPVTRTVDFSDWRPVEGIMFPFKQQVSENGEPAGSATVQEIQINPPVDAALFAKPPAPTSNQ